MKKIILALLIAIAILTPISYGYSYCSNFVLQGKVDSVVVKKYIKEPHWVGKVYVNRQYNIEVIYKNLVGVIDNKWLYDKVKEGDVIEVNYYINEKWDRSYIRY